MMKMDTSPDISLGARMSYSNAIDGAAMSAMADTGAFATLDEWSPNE